MKWRGGVVGRRAPYQDRWRDGALVEKGRRECAGRFKAIAGHLGTVGSLVDVGGWDGYFARRFAEAGVSCVLIEPRNVADLPAGVAHRQEHVDAATVFSPVDAALALAVLHHMGDWEDVYRHLRCASETLIVEAAHPDELDGPMSQTLIDTGDRIAPVYERVLRDGSLVVETPGPNGVPRPIVAVTNTRKGTVEDGSGRASEEMTVLPEQFWGPLGYQPATGTLNLRVGRAGKAWVRNLPAPVTLDDEAGDAAGPYWPVTVAGIDAHVRTSRAQTVVEVVAPVRFRDQGVGNGDDLVLRPR